MATGDGELMRYPDKLTPRNDIKALKIYMEILKFSWIIGLMVFDVQHGAGEFKTVNPPYVVDYADILVGDIHMVPIRTECQSSCLILLRKAPAKNREVFAVGTSTKDTW